jgi:hypothetical protein
MIEPMMATMLGFVTTDAAVPPALLDRALREAVDRASTRSPWTATLDQRLRACCSPAARAARPSTSRATVTFVAG